MVVLNNRIDKATHPPLAKDKRSKKTVILTCRLTKMASLLREISFLAGDIIQVLIDNTIRCKNKKGKCRKTQTTTTTSTTSRRSRTSRWTCRTTASPATARTTCSRPTQDTDKEAISKFIIQVGSRALLIMGGIIITGKGK